MNLSVICVSESRRAEAEWCARQAGLPLATSVNAKDDYALIFSDADVRLRSNSQAHGDVVVEFSGGRAAHRRRYGGGKGQSIAKAVGVQGAVRPSVCDLTGGLGQDGFVLASLGCEVTLTERHPVVYSLLEDGLARARVFAEAGDPELLEILGRVHLQFGDGVEFLRKMRKPPAVVYLDPMFPERKKSARVKKEMQAFHELVGADEDASELLRAALAVAENRVVVKRPRRAPYLADLEPSFRLEGKSSRYDVYALKKLGNL